MWTLALLSSLPGLARLEDRAVFAAELRRAGADASRDAGAGGRPRGERPRVHAGRVQAAEGDEAAGEGEGVGAGTLRDQRVDGWQAARPLPVPHDDVAEAAEAG